MTCNTISKTSTVSTTLVRNGTPSSYGTQRTTPLVYAMSGVASHNVAGESGDLVVARDLGELFWIEARATDQTTVDVLLGHQFDDRARLD